MLCVRWRFARWSAKAEGRGKGPKRGPKSACCIRRGAGHAIPQAAASHGQLMRRHAALTQRSRSARERQPRSVHTRGCSSDPAAWAQPRAAHELWECARKSRATPRTLSAPGPGIACKAEQRHTAAQPAARRSALRGCRSRGRTHLGRRCAVIPCHRTPAYGGCAPKVAVRTRLRILSRPGGAVSTASETTARRCNDACAPTIQDWGQEPRWPEISMGGERQSECRCEDSKSPE